MSGTGRAPIRIQRPELNGYVHQNLIQSQTIAVVSALMLILTFGMMIFMCGSVTDIPIMLSISTGCSFVCLCQSIALMWLIPVTFENGTTIIELRWKIDTTKYASYIFLFGGLSTLIITFIQGIANGSYTLTVFGTIALVWMARLMYLHHVIEKNKTIIINK